MTHRLFLAACLIFFLLSPAQAEDQFDSYVVGQTAFLIVNQKSVIRLNSRYGGLAASQRIKIVESRLKKLLANGPIEAESFKVLEQQGNTWLVYQGNRLVIADPSTAYWHRTTPRKLAALWRANLEDALRSGAKDLNVTATFQGMASWYGKEFRGRKTANGEVFDENRYTAAHRHLAFGTKLRVTNLKNKQTVIVTVNDRGPWIRGRIIDLSRAAARAIGITGVAKVTIEVLQDL